MRQQAVLSLVVLLVVSGCTSGGGSATPAAPTTSASGATVAPSPTPQPTHLRVRRTHWRLPQPLGREAVVAQGAGAPVVVAGGLLAGNASSSSSYTLGLADDQSRRFPTCP